MKKTMLLAMLLLAISAVPAFAEIEGVAGAKFDAPNLVRFNQDWTLGMEASKDLYNILPNDQSAWIEDDRGFAGYVKVTCKWTLLDFSKK